MAFISVRNLGKKYLVAEKSPGLVGTFRHFFNRRIKRVTAVHRLNFDIEAGEIVGFIGPNGAGKTTTLKMLCGLIHPSEGEIAVAGHIPRFRKEAFLKQITLVMGQKQQLMWDLPPMDSLRVNATVYGLTDIEANIRIHQIAEMLELGEELYRPVRKLSLGQRMKAELLASLLHRPSILFLDEPTLGLDINAQTRVREFLREYNKKFTATILLTSHYMGDIDSLCKRVILIHQGTLFYDGKLKDLLDKLTPTRLLLIQLKHPVKPKDISTFTNILEHSDLCLKVLVDRNELTEKLAYSVNFLPIKDLKITDPPIEELIAKVFTQQKIDHSNNL